MGSFEKTQQAALEQLRAELTERVVKTHRHLHEREQPISPKFDDQVVEMANEELVRNLDSGGRDELRRIAKALTRIDEGVYGLCVTCGKEIALPRLEAIPFAEECVSCASKP